MSETSRPQVEDKSDFPDEESPERAGCYMYAFYKLGLDPEKARMGVYPKMLNKYLTRVDSKNEADALGIRHKINGRYDHMVFIDQANNGEMKQRGNVGWPIEATSLDILEEHYPPNNYEYVFMKKKTKSTGKSLLLRAIQRVREKTTSA